jgi:2-desacetyl-2-hydroxyethyl bacteriochlorophyllide A dehydrogenase
VLVKVTSNCREVYHRRSMRCLWLREGALTCRDDVEAPVLRDGEARVRVNVAGVCATDLELCRGYYPFEGVLGHEFVGRVVEAPSAPELVGERVVGEINAPCGRCATCLAGLGNHCPDRTVLGIVGRGGAFAEELVLPVANLHRLPGGLSTERATFVEPLAAASQICEQVALRPTDRVLVVGAGRLGQLVARLLVGSGCELVVVARHRRQRELLEEVGIAAIRDVAALPSRRFDVVVEASGSPSGFEVARAAVRPRGTIVLKSTYAGRLELDASAIVVDEITLVGSRCGTFAPAIRVLASGRIDPAPLIEATYPIERGVEALEHAGRPGALKVLITIDGGGEG